MRMSAVCCSLIAANVRSAITSVLDISFPTSKHNMFILSAALDDCHSGLVYPALTLAHSRFHLSRSSERQGQQPEQFFTETELLAHCLSYGDSEKEAARATEHTGTFVRWRLAELLRRLRSARISLIH